MARPSLLSVCAVSLGLGTLVGSVPRHGGLHIPFLYVSGVNSGVSMIASLVTSPTTEGAPLRRPSKPTLRNPNVKARSGALAILP